MKLLFCSANPLQDLDLMTELEGVLHGINAKNWDVIYLHDATAESLSVAMHKHLPDIVHFCGHSSVDEVVFVNPTTGGVASIAPETFGRILGTTRPLKAIVLNACKSFAVFEKLRDAAEWGIGTTRNIADSECIDFSRHFYNRLSENPDVHDAYTFAVRRMPDDSKRKIHLQHMTPPRAFRWWRAPKAFLLTVSCALLLIALVGMTAYNIQRTRELESSVKELNSRLSSVGGGPSAQRSAIVEGDTIKNAVWGSTEGLKPFPTTWTEVPGLSIQVKTSGRPMLIVLAPGQGTHFPSGIVLSTFAYNLQGIRIMKDDTTVLAEFSLQLSAVGQNNFTVNIGSQIALPPSAVQAFDLQPGQATHKYDVRIKAEPNTSGYTSLSNLRLLAIEL